MPSSTPNTETAIKAVLHALYPLISTPDQPSRNHAITQIRSLRPESPLLAATLYNFSKVIINIPSSVDSYKAVVNGLLATNPPLLEHAHWFNAIDAETDKMFSASDKAKKEEKVVRTRLWYTQKRYNLFREENEGYAKLVALLWEVVLDHRRQTIVDDLLALVGKFCLDSNRVIELVLSAAADVVHVNIQKSGNFPSDHRLPKLFVQLLDTFEKKHVASVVGAVLQTSHAVSSRLGTLSSPAESSTALQLRGEPEGKTPESFFLLVVVLIREGRMTVADIWNNMSPRDDRDLVHRFLAYENKLHRLADHVSSYNLNRSMPKDDDELFVRTGLGATERDIFSQYKFVTAGPFDQFTCQKLTFIALLINMCRWDDAMDAILSLGINGHHIDIAAQPAIGGALASFVEALLNPILCKHFPGMYTESKHLTEAIANLGGRKNRCPCPVLSIEQFLDDKDTNGPGAVVIQILRVLGPHARTSPGLLIALCRILKVVSKRSARAIVIMQEVVLPANSLLQSNVGLAAEIWAVLRTWAHVDRWQLYGHMQNVVANTCAVYRVVASRASYETRYVLKRLTTANMDPRHLTTIAKITQGQALPAFMAAVDRVQGYPPDLVTIGPLVEACMDVSELAVDMLLYIVIERMSDQRKNRLKEDGINIAQWYATLSLFLGSCMRRLRVNSQQVEGVLSFLYTKLVVDEEPLLITALGDLIKCVADLDVESNLTTMQIEAQSGGRYLRDSISGVWSRLQPDIKLVGNIFDVKNERQKQTAVSSLLAAFHNTGMHVYIAIAIAQLTRDAIFTSELKVKPLKLGAKIVDRARVSLLQLSQFMDSDWEEDSWRGSDKPDIWKPIRKVGLARLIGKMGVSAASAVVLMSPVLDYLRTCEKARGFPLKTDNENPNQVSTNVKTSSLSAPKSSSGKKTGKGKNGKDDTSPRGPKSDNGDIEMEAGEIDPRKAGLPDDMMRNNKVPKPSIYCSEEEFAEILAKRAGGCVTPEFLKSFWTLKLEDISPPPSLYDNEIARLQAIRKTWEKEVDRNRRHDQGDAERRRRSDSELRMIRDFIESLSSEKNSQKHRQLSVMDALRANRTALFTAESQESAAAMEKTVSAVLQECILPRCRISSSDAIFCARFVFFLLQLDIPVLSFAKYFKRLLRLIPQALSSCSEDEAISITRLVKEVLTTLEKWRSNRKVFDNEAAISKKFGFRDEQSSSAKPLPHEQYCEWLFTIHENLTQGLCVILGSDEYLYARNSMCVLAGIADVFPKVAEHSTRIEQCVSKLTNSNLQDIQLTAKSVLALLKSGKAKRVPTHIFKLKPFSGGSAAAKPKKNTASSEPAANASTGSKAVRLMTSHANQSKQKTDATLPEKGTSGHEAGKSSALPDTRRNGESEKQSLNPNARVYVPGITEKGSSGLDKSAGGGMSQKRGREKGAGFRQRNGAQEIHGNDGRHRARSPEQPPPAKRSRVGENRRNGDGSKRGTPIVGSEPRDNVKRGSVPVKDAPIQLKTLHSAGAPPQPQRASPSQRHGAVREGSGRDSSMRNDHGHSTRDSGREISGGKVSHLPPPVNGSGNRDQSARGVSDRNGHGREVRGGASRDGRDGVSRDGRDGASRDDREGPNRDSSTWDGNGGDVPGRETAVRDAPIRSPQGRDHANREPGRDVSRRDSHAKDTPNREQQIRDQPNREAPRRDELRRELSSRDPGIARDGHSRDMHNRNGGRSESPGKNLQRRGSSRDLASREANGNLPKEAARRRKGSENHSPYQYTKPGEMGGKHELVEFDEESQGAKRRRGDFNPPRGSYAYEGDGRRPRPRTDEGAFRDRVAPRDDGGHRRFNGEQPSPGRFEGSGFVPQKGGGWNEQRRSSHEGGREGRGGGAVGGGARRRDHEADGGAGWKGRADDRVEFEDRPPVGARGRDEGRGENEYGGFDDRGGNRGGDRYRERRNGGRDDRNRYGRRHHNGRSGSRRARQ